MSEPVEEQSRTGGREAASVSSSVASTSAVSTEAASTGSGSTSAVSTTPGAAAESSAVSSEVGPSHALLGPFTLREVVFGVGVLVVFIGTLLPFVDGRVLYTTFWSSTSLFFIGIGILLPVIALALLAGRRLGSAGLRVGSLSVDQFASVSAVLAATFFFLQTVTAFHLGAFLGLIGSLGLLAATVLGPFLPGIKNDFTDRPEVAAHPSARPITAAAPRPPKATKPAADTATGFAATTDSASSSTGLDTADNSGSGSAGPGADGVRTAGVGGTQGVIRASGSGAAGSVAANRNPITVGGSSRNPTVSSVKGSKQDGSASSRPLVEGATDSEAVHTGARAVGTSSTGDDAPKGVRSTFASGRTPGPEVAADVTSEGAAIDETRVHEAVRDDPAVATTTASATSNTTGSGSERSRQEPITATRSAEEEQVVEAFWFAVGSPRPVFDEQTGRELFVLQPGDWEVGIEDRGRDFLVQDKRSGAVGILRDLRNIERAPRD